MCFAGRHGRKKKASVACWVFIKGWLGRTKLARESTDRREREMAIFGSPYSAIELEARHNSLVVQIVDNIIAQYKHFTFYFG